MTTLFGNGTSGRLGRLGLFGRLWPAEPIDGILLRFDRSDGVVAGTAAAGFGVDGLLPAVLPGPDLETAELAASLGNSLDGSEAFPAIDSRDASFAGIVFDKRDLLSLLSLTSPSSTSPVADERAGWNSGAVGRRFVAWAACLGSSLDSPAFSNISFENNPSRP